MNNFLILTTGSVLGGLARYYLAGFIYWIMGTSFPYGTMVVNLSGCFLIGFLYSLAEEKFIIGPNGRLLLMVGFCGAFTTFSTFMLETANLLKDGETWPAFLNIFLSVVGGFLVLRLGILLAELI